MRKLFNKAAYSFLGGHVHAANQNNAAQPEDDGNEVPPATFREKFNLLKSFWASGNKWKPRSTTLLVFGLILADVAGGAGVGLCMQEAINSLVDAVTTKNIVPVMANLGGCAAIGFLQTLVCKQQEFKAMCLRVRWRGWLTETFQDAWLKDKSFYQLTRKKGVTYHADQRIAQDMAEVSDHGISLGLGLFKAGLNIVTYTALLIVASPWFVAAAVGFAIFNSGITHLMGKSLQKKNNELARCEAVFRNALIDVADNSDHIALANLENVEKKILDKSANEIFEAKIELTRRERNLGYFTDYTLRATDIIPLAIAVPVIIYGGASVGSLELSRRYYKDLSAGASWWTQGYTLYARFNACASRLVHFSKGIEQTKKEMPTSPATPELRSQS